MELVRRLAAWGAVLALARCGHDLNTPEELRLGREAIEHWRSSTTTTSTTNGSCCPGLGGRVFGGFVTHVGLYPYAVYVMAKEPGRLWQCSGSILSPQWVLSAAHCMGKRNDWTAIIFAGDVDFTTNRVFTKVNIQMRALCEAYQYKKNDTYHHDIVLFKLWRGFTLQAGFVEPITLTDVKAYPTDFKERCTVVGFGRRGRNLKPDTGLQRAGSFLMEPGHTCNVPEIRENGLCTHDVATRSVCSGDSGGPIFCADRLVQFGMILGVYYENCTIDYCGAPCLFNIHMFVGFYRDWILNTMHPPTQERSAATRRPTTALALLLAGLLLSRLIPSINTCTPL